MEFGVRSMSEHLRWPGFFDLSCSEYRDQVRINDCVESMCDSNHSGFSKFILQEPQLDGFSHHIDVGSGFVHNHNFVFAHQSSTDADQLSLTWGQISTTWLNLVAQEKLAVPILQDQFVQAWLLDQLSNFVVWVGLEGINVESETSLEKSWFLRDHSHLFTKFL